MYSHVFPFIRIYSWFKNWPNAFCFRWLKCYQNFNV